MSDCSLRHRLFCRWFVAVAIAFFGLLASRSSWAQDETQSAGDAGLKPGVYHYTGSFATSVPLVVPGYHGIEPALALTYSANGGNGWLGVGWALAGGTQIVRACPGRGAPRYDATDIFQLDGQELVASTALGGTHSTKIQSYLQITRDAANDRWIVRGKSGVMATLTAVETTPSGTYRWAVTSVKDTHGNLVSYSYSCDGYGCDLSTITYNGTQISFIGEGRPDPVTYATGVTTGRKNYRLKRIEERVSGALARIYVLAYQPSAGTQQSLLTGVQMYGSDATVNASGVVSGTALPPTTLGYASGAGSLGAVATWLTQTGTWKADQAQYADVNGDGKLDLIHRKTDNTIWVSLSTGSGFAAPVQWHASLAPTYATDQAHFADVDGDGKADLLFRKSDNSIWVGKSTGAGFTTATSWVAEGGAYSQGQAQYADVNGDGKVDLIFQSGSTFRVSLSTGTGFAAYTTWATIADTGAAAADRARYVDLNGDGKADLVYRKSADNTLWVGLSTGTSFGTPTNWLSLGGTYEPGEVHYGDFNGDGKTDLVFRSATCTTSSTTCQHCGSCPTNCCGGTQITLGTGSCQYANFSCTGGPNAQSMMKATSSCKACTASGTIQVAISTGNGFEPLATWQTVASMGYVAGGTLSSGQLKSTDINGDGRADLIIQDTSQNFSVLLSTGTGFAAPVVWATNAGPAYENDQAQLADVDGDGRDDLVFRDSTQVYKVWLSQPPAGQPSGQPTDALVSMTGPLGGKTTVTYRPSSAFPNTYLPEGMVFPTVSFISLSDGRGNTSTRSYTYQGAKWSDADRRLLGFAKVNEVLDAAGTYREIHFHQNVDCGDQPDSVYLRNAAGNIYSYESYTYADSTAPPYTAPVTDKWSFECNLGTSCRRVLQQFAYDLYGNVTQVKAYGDYDVSGDERLTVTSYQPNASAYIVSLPAYVNVYQGLTTATLVQQTLHYYDGATSYTTMPTRGDATKTSAWNNQGGTVDTSSAYDAYGNVTSTTDPMGSTSTTAYDTTYHLFPTQACNALSQCASSAWNTVLGVKISDTNVNGRVTSTTFDVLARPLRTTFANGGWSELAYMNTGSPTAQYVETRASDGSADGLWSRIWQDGLSRKYLETREGGYSKQTIYAADVPSRVAKQSAWYGSGETPQYDVFSYDGANRLTKVTHADGSVASSVYGVGSVTAHDEQDHPKTTYIDGWGRLSRVREINGASSYDTTYAYDVLGRLTSTTDSAGNQTSTTWDSLGRKLSGCDPDMGCWSYTYNAAGSVLTQTDAKGQTLTMTYDALQRPLTKTHPNGDAYHWTYDQTGHGDGKGHVTTASYPAGSDSFSYDFAGRATSQTTCRGTTCYTIGTTYDTTAQGRLTSVVYPDETVTYAYNSNGELTAVPGYVTSFAYNARGQITSAAYANGTTAAYAYSTNRYRLTQAKVNAGAIVLYQQDYTYASDGLITSMTVDFDNSSPATTNFGYDGLHRLTTIGGGQTQTLAYDALGDITSNSLLGSYAYGAATHKHAVTAAGANTYGYDTNGNTTGGAGRALTWDAENRVTSVSGATMAYDGTGQRVKKVHGTTTLYFGNLLELSGSTVYKYVYAGSRLVARRTGLGVKHYYQQDHLGSTRLITDDNALVVKRDDYRPFGGVLSETGTLTTNTIGFTGQRLDESGLVYMNARYYDPALGRFVSADSLVAKPTDPQDFNRYSYVHNNPLSYCDPTGHFGYAPPAGSGVAGHDLTWGDVALAGEVVAAGAWVVGHFVGVSEVIDAVILGASGVAAVANFVQGDYVMGVLDAIAGVPMKAVAIGIGLLTDVDIGAFRFGAWLTAQKSAVVGLAESKILGGILKEGSGLMSILERDGLIRDLAVQHDALVDALEVAAQMATRSGRTMGVLLDSSSLLGAFLRNEGTLAIMGGKLLVDAATAVSAINHAIMNSLFGNSGVTGSGAAFVNTGNNPGNPNAPGYFGGGGAGNGGFVNTGNNPGNPNAPGYNGGGGAGSGGFVNNGNNPGNPNAPGYNGG